MGCGETAGLIVRSGHRDQFENARDDTVGIDTAGLGIEGENEAMAQYVRTYALHIVGADVIAAREPGAGAGAAVERNGGARAGAELDPSAERLVVGGRLSSRYHQLHDVLLVRVGNV